MRRIISLGPASFEGYPGLRMKSFRCARNLVAMVVCFGGLLSAAWAQQPEVGREAAARYFGGPAPRSPSSEIGPEDHYLALHLGRFMEAQTWDWGADGRVDDTGSYSVGVTYRMYEWRNSMDLNIRIDFNEYKVADEKPLKMTLMPLLTFPDASARFPLYFGLGAGLGVFFKQLKDESPLAFDYQLVMGARFFDVFENTGFFLEAGLKNHLLLTSTGQTNGTYLTGGAVFTF